MPELIPSILLYGQALSLLQTLQANYSTGQSKTVDEVSSDLRDILNRFETSAGKPLTKYEPVVEYEPPLSQKMNRFWDNMAKDIALIGHQLDVLRSAAVFTHNFITTEILKAQQNNASLNNKLKALQFYANVSDPSIIIFGDTFSSDEFLDNTFVDPSVQASITDGVLVLGNLGDLTDLSHNTTITLLPESNGFLGNNQEIDDPTTAKIDPLTNQPLYTFKAETDRHEKLSAITDGNPNTWIEYEFNLIQQADVTSANNLNFTYIDLRDVNSPTYNTEVQWQTGAPQGKLLLGLQFKFDSPQNINHITYSPYGLSDNSNFPVLVKLIEVSPDGNDWTPIDPPNVWIGTETNLRAARTADNVTIGTATWNFDNTTAQYLRVHIEQDSPVNSLVGHQYYLDSTTSQRTKGPVPTTDNPAKYYSYGQGNPTQSASTHREYFQGSRWVIGIRDIALQQRHYSPTGIVISELIQVPGIVDSVAIEADVTVPSMFPTDQAWAQFSVSPDNGNSWFPISPIKDDILGVPEVISFNNPLPSAFQDPSISYVTTNDAVSSIRVKIVLLRPNDLPMFTPEVKSYSVKIRKR